MSAITNEQLYSEIENLKQELRQLREPVTQYQVVQTTHPHIAKFEGHQGGEPIVRSAYVTVRTIVEQNRLGTTAEEFVKDHPPMSLAEFYDALSYYYDHTDEIEQIIEENHQALIRGVEFAKRIAKKNKE